MPSNLSNLTLLLPTKCHICVASSYPQILMNFIRWTCTCTQCAYQTPKLSFEKLGYIKKVTHLNAGDAFSNSFRDKT